MATGDLNGNLERLRVQLRTIGYPHPLDLPGLKDGNPASILPLLQYALLAYSRHVSRYLSENGYALFAKSDLRFVECTLKFLREEFGYRCPLTVAQVCKRKNSELVKSARQALQARKLFRGEATFSDVVKNIDAANLDSVHLDETLEQALEKVFRVQDRIGRNTSKGGLKVSRSDEPGQSEAVPALQMQAQEVDLMESALAGNEPTENSKVHRMIEVIRSKNVNNVEGNERQDGAICKSSDHSVQLMERSRSSQSPYDVDASLSTCYEHLRQQIVDVAEKLEKQLLSLEGDVQRNTTNMQAKLSSLERQAQFLEHMFSSHHLNVGMRAPTSYEHLHIYDRGLPLRRPDESLQIPFPHTIRDISNSHQNHIWKGVFNSGMMNVEIPQSIRSTIMQQQQRLTTQELIASVKARCNKTKELLMDNGWNGTI